MSFFYHDYRKFYLFFPGIIMLCSIGFDCIHIYSIIQAILNGTSYAGYLWPIFCTIPVMIISIVLLRHGIRMIFNHNADLLITTGHIQRIERFYIRPNAVQQQYNRSIRLLDGELRLPGNIYIDGQKYICLNVDNLTEGQTLQIGYMPRSKCVLYYVVI